MKSLFHLVHVHLVYLTVIKCMTWLHLVYLTVIKCMTWSSIFKALPDSCEVEYQVHEVLIWISNIKFQLIQRIKSIKSKPNIKGGLLDSETWRSIWFRLIWVSLPTKLSQWVNMDQILHWIFVIPQTGLCRVPVQLARLNLVWKPL